MNLLSFYSVGIGLISAIVLYANLKTVKLYSDVLGKHCSSADWSFTSEIEPCMYCRYMLTLRHASTVLFHPVTCLCTLYKQFFLKMYGNHHY